MATLAALMISNVPYPAVPPVGYKSRKQILGSLIVVGSILGLILLPKQFMFPAAVAYVAFGIIQWAVMGLLGKSSSPDQIYWDGEPPAAVVSAPRHSWPSSPIAPVTPLPVPVDGVLDEDDGGVDRMSQREERDRQQRRRRRRRGGRGNRPDRGNNPGGPSSSEPPDEPNP